MHRLQKERVQRNDYEEFEPNDERNENKARVWVLTCKVEALKLWPK